jgi:hypothetical protein
MGSEQESDWLDMTAPAQTIESALVGRDLSVVGPGGAAPPLEIDPSVEANAQVSSHDRAVLAPSRDGIANKRDAPLLEGPAPEKESEERPDSTISPIHVAGGVEEVAGDGQFVPLAPTAGPRAGAERPHPEVETWNGHSAGEVASGAPGAVSEAGVAPDIEGPGPWGWPAAYPLESGLRSNASQPSPEVPAVVDAPGRSDTAVGTSDVLSESPLYLAESTCSEAAAGLHLDAERWICGISFESLGSAELGHYDPQSRIMVLNSDLTSPGESLELQHTVAHETFHAYQNQEVAALESGLACDPRATEWAASWDHYIDPAKPGVSWDQYASQPLERDAEDFANSFMGGRRPR